MKRIYPFIAFLLFSYFSFAQYENVDLSKYKLPDIKRHQLDFEFGADGESEYRKVNYDSTETNIYDNSNAHINSNLLYSYFKNTEKVQGNLDIDFETSFISDRQEQNSEVWADKSTFNNVLRVSYEAKYFLRNKWFYLLDPYLYLSYNHQENDDRKSHSNSTSVSPSFGVGFGKGRIEQVQDYRQAILIINELEKRGVLNRTLTEDELLEFAQEISIIKNERFFDSRKRKEKELKTIHSFLHQRGLIADSDINYYVGLDDMWRYGARQTRESGDEIKFVVFPGYVYDNWSGNIYEQLNLGGAIRYKYRKPLNLKWQFNSNLDLNHYYHKILDQDGISTSETKYRSNFIANSTVGYYPNTRTYISAHLSLVIENRSNEKVLDADGYSEHIRIATNAYYYISEKLRLGVDISYKWYNNATYGRTVTGSGSNNFNYDLALSYAIF
nr:hypothetical protein [uncultured Draconibacterium sp.]